MPTPDIVETGPLIDHILSRYHDHHRDTLPDLAALAVRVERVHGDDPAAPKGLGALIEDIIAALELHMHKEELMLFPVMRAGPSPVLAMRMAVMQADHEQLDAEVAQILALTHNLALPAQACASWTALYQGLREFVADLAEHMRLEEDVLFPRFAPAV